MTPTSWSSTSSWGKRPNRGLPSGSRRPTGLPPSHYFLRWWDGRRPRRCWAVPPSHLFHPSRPCMRSGHQCAYSRARVLLNILSLHEKGEIKVGRWGIAPIYGAFRRPTLFLKGGTHGTPPKQKKRKDSRDRYSATFASRNPHIHRVAFKRSCCHQNRSVQRGHLRWVRPQSAASHSPPDPAMTPGFFV